MPKKKIQRPATPHRVGGGPEDSLGARVKKLRKDAGWSLRELARRTGIGHSTLQNYESGLRLPGVSQLRKLSEQLGASAHVLIFGSEWSRSDDSGAATFFGAHNNDTYPFNLAAAMRALPVPHRQAVEVMLDALLVGAVGRERLPRIAEIASWSRFRMLEASGGEWMPEVAPGMPWPDDGIQAMIDQAGEETPEKPLD